MWIVTLTPDLWTSCTMPWVVMKKFSLSVLRVSVAAWLSITLAIYKKSNLLFLINILIFHFNGIEIVNEYLLIKLCSFDFVEWLHIEIQEYLSPLNIQVDETTAMEGKI